VTPSTTSGSETTVPVEETVTGQVADIADYDGEATERAQDKSAPTEEATDTAATDDQQRQPKWMRAKRIVAFGVLPILALILAAGSGYLKWQVDSAREAQSAQVESVPAATESTIAILSYQPDSAEKELTAARDRLTEPFKDQYTKLITDVVIPGSKQKKISAIATVPAAASISATHDHAVVLVFIDQSIVIGTDAPTSTSSTVRVTLDKDGDKWLISQFDPV
jgi:Mce-associated membrane protein